MTSDDARVRIQDNIGGVGHAHRHLILNDRHRPHQIGAVVTPFLTQGFRIEIGNGAAVAAREDGAAVIGELSGSDDLVVHLELLVGVGVQAESVEAALRIAPKHTVQHIGELQTPDRRAFRLNQGNTRACTMKRQQADRQNARQLHTYTHPNCNPT